MLDRMSPSAPRKSLKPTTTSDPEGSKAIAKGKLKRASAPLPSIDPAFPARPASVVTVPSGAILRMV